ncbi:hypothetical protein KY366_00955, partial [Candidatus Woesearchaeota archaeon]|nr:hypothetical protein [Candidatus Woesearchaeota archaeon]
MNNKLILLVAMFCMIPLVYSASIELTLPSSVIQGDNELASFSVMANAPFSGTVSLGYDNMESSVSAVAFENDSFIGAGDYYIYTHSWQVKGIDPGQYSVAAYLKDIYSHILDTDEVAGSVNSSAPVILSRSPGGIVTTSSVTLAAETDEEATCRYSTENTTSYDSMGSTFSITGSTHHSQVISSLSETSYTYYIRCEDSNGYRMSEPEKISFKVDFPPSAEIALSDESPIKAGTLEVTVLTSENLETTPVLQYSFDDAPSSRKIVSLTGEDSVWKGYMIITASDDNRVGTFHFSGKDDLGTIGDSITEGKIFLVDTSKPPKPLNIEPIMLPGGDIKIKWYYEGEPVDSFNIYRSTSSGVEYIDFYSSTENTSYYNDASVSNEVTYYYKVAAVDKAGNIGPLSEEVYATSVSSKKQSKEKSTETKAANEKDVDEPKVLPPNLVVKVDDAVKRVEQLEIDVKDAGSKLENSGTEKKDIINELGLIENANTAKSTVEKLKGDLENLKLSYMTSSDLDFELERIDMEVERIRKTTSKDVTLIEKT